jgi:hypothetical protein
MPFFADGKSLLEGVKGVKRVLSLELCVWSFGFSLVASFGRAVFPPIHAKHKMLIEE